MPNPMSLGITSKLYVNTGVSYNTPTWTECGLVGDMTVNMKWNEGDSSVRQGRVQTAEPTNLMIEITGKIRKKLSDAAYAAILEAFLDGTTADVLVLDGDMATTSSQGVRFEGVVFNFSEDQGLQAVIFNEFSMKPSAQTDNLPKSAVVTGGNLTYRTFGT